MRVPRSRFLPVKKCSDLLALRSDCFVVTDDGDIVVNPRRKLDALKIRLDEAYYGKVDDFNARFASGAPSLVDCASLTVEGDVFFQPDVEITGDVTITNPGETPVTIQSGTTIDHNLTL